MARKLSAEVVRRRQVQWLLLPIVIVTIALGWKYPFLGYSVPIVMLTGMTMGAFKGRYICGKYCPRGGFADRLVSMISPKKPISQFLMGMQFRLIIFAALMSFLTFRMINKPVPLDWASHIGKVFWFMCVVTTSIDVLLGLAIHQRTWCAFCPIGTVGHLAGKGKFLFQIDKDKCKECMICEKACPMTLEIVKFKPVGKLINPDCIKCGECVGACPTRALSLPLASG